METNIDEKDNNTEKKAITLNENSLVMDINIIEVPVFNFNQRLRRVTVDELLELKDVHKDVKHILSMVEGDLRKAKVGFKQWEDSKGNMRAILSTSMFDFPDAFCMDVLYGLVALYIEKSLPVIEIENKLTFETNKVSFKMSELCRVLRIPNGGKDYDRVKKAIMRLDATKYYSLDSGAFYSKELGKYISSNEESINLVDSFKFSKNTKDRECKVVLGELVIANLKHKHIKFLEKRNYFSLQTGLTRRLYTYIEGNRYNKDYLKREFKTLKNKIPIDYRFPSDLKTRLKQPLQNLIDAGVITDYFYGDEFKVNGIKEQCIYFIFKGTKSTLIKHLEEEYAKKQPKKLTAKEKVKNNLEQEAELVFPEDIKQELVNFGINPKKITEIMSKYSKYKIAEYILWLKDGISKGKAKDPAGMFVFAITDEMIKVGRTHPHIIEFVARYKAEIEGKLTYTESDIQTAYRKYIDLELDKFKEEDEFMFESMQESVLDDIEEVKDKRIKAQRQLYNMSETKKEKEKMLKMIDKWEKFDTEREKSDIFIEQFVKKIKLYRGLKEYHEFKQEFVEKNS